MELRHVHIQCECSHPDHLARFTLDPDDPLDLTLSFHMNPKQPFFRRLVASFQYLFGINKHRYWGDSWTTVILRKPDVVRLQKLLTEYTLLSQLHAKLKAKRRRESLKP